MPSQLSVSIPSSRSLQEEIVRIASMRAVHAAFHWLHLRDREIDEWHAELAAIPAPPFGEERRARWLQERLEKAEMPGATIDGAGNVLAHYPASQALDSSPQLLVAAHLDTVFPEGTNFLVRRSERRIYAPGVGDNTAGVVALLACAAAIRQSGLHFEHNIVFAGTVGEEGEGDLRGMRHLFREQRWRDRTHCTLVLDGAGTETIVHEGLGSRRLEITLHGPGGHSWNNHGTANPVVALANVVTRMAEIELPAKPKTTLNVGSFHGGASTNAIPEESSIRVDIRSADPAQIERVEGEVRELVQQTVEQHVRSNRRPEITSTIKVIGDRPAGTLPEGARILRVIKAVDAHLKLESGLRRASTDANIPLSLGLEAVSIGVGGTGDGAHTLHEWYDAEGREIGLKRVLLAILALAHVI